MTCSLREALEKYEVYARARGFTAPTIEHTRRCVTLFDDFLGGTRAVGEITALDFRRFVADLRDRPTRHTKQAEGRKLSGTSVNTYARAIRAFFSWLKTEGLIAANPLLSEPAPKKPRTIPKVYSEEQLRAIFTAVTRDLRNRAIVFWLVDSGPRLSEICQVDTDRVDTRQGTARIMGKGQKERIVPFRSDTAEAIDEYVKKGRPTPRGTSRLFLTEGGTPLSAKGIQSMLDRLGKEAGVVDRLSPHKLRHSCATLSLKYGGNLEYIKVILGHTDIKTTSDAYLNVDFSDVKAAHDKFSPLSNLIHGAEHEGTRVPTRPAGQPGVSGASGRGPERAEPESTRERHAERERTLSRARREQGAGAAPDCTGGTDSAQAPVGELYRQHLERLALLAGNLATDIEQGRLEEPRPTDAPPGGAFPGVNIAKVFRSQNDRLWPFLSRHLDNEFPSFTAEIARLAAITLVDRVLRKPATKLRLAERARAKLIMVSERGTFEGTCDVCRKYFRDPGRHQERAGGG